MRLRAETLFPFVLAALLLAVAAPAFAAPDFPALTGRVVDEAGLLSAATKRKLTDELARNEKQTSNQVVVVTLKSLQGLTIEDYGYQLGRHWGIGQKGKDNGALLIVAPNEHKVRIEVGYGLEGSLTDALTSTIIQTEILPSFRSGDYEDGIVKGTAAILATIGGTYQPKQQSGTTAKSGSGLFGGNIVFLLFFGLWAVGFFASRFGAFGYGGRSRRYYGGGFGGGGFGGGGGGFSGGGGSFGGGGSSGSW